MLITSVAKHGLWASTDGGASWTAALAPGGHRSRSPTAARRSSSIPRTPTRSGSRASTTAGGVYRTTDNGATFTPLGDARHIDSVSVDLADPQRQTLLAGGHEQKQTLYRSANGGATWTNVGMNLPAGTNFCTNALVSTSTSTWWAARATRAAPTASSAPPTAARRGRAPTTPAAAAMPLWASDGTIYWSLIYDRGLIKSTDQGHTWTQPIRAATLKTGHPIELPDGRIVAPGPRR